jgi:hypothetical protein
MMRRGGTIVLILVWASGLWAAQEVANLYQARVSVTGQGDEERASAFRSALIEVMARVSGRTATVTRRAEDLVTRYHYTSDVDGLHLVVDFDPAAVDRLLAQHRVPVWGARRPSTLVWVVVQEKDGTSHLAGSEGPSPYQVPLQREAARRGLLLVWPLLDLVESLPTVEGDKPEGAKRVVAALRVASQSYPVEAVLIGRLTSTPHKAISTAPLATENAEGEDWMVRWTLLRGRAEDRWETTGVDPTAVLIAGVDGLAERLAAGTPASNGGPAVQTAVIQVVVMGADSLGNYARVRTYLEGLTEVAQVWPVRLDPEGRLTFAVEPRVSATELAGTLGRGGLLQAEEVPLDLSALGDSTLYYQLVP